MVTNPLLNEVTIIVVTFQSAHCLDALSPLLSFCPHVVFFDNGSEDGCADLAQNIFPHANVIKHVKNIGFGAANNRALEKVTTPWALLLNPDCEMSLQALQDLMVITQSDDPPAIIAPQLINSFGKLDVNYRWPSNLWSSIGPEAQGPTCVGFVCGAVLLMDLVRLKRINFFDERFFLYYEDDDLCLRLFQEKSPIVIYPAIKVIHKSRGSVKGNFSWHYEYIRGYHHVQSKLTYMQKHGDASALKNVRLKLIAMTTLTLLLRIIFFTPNMMSRTWGRFRGLIEWKL